MAIRVVRLGTSRKPNEGLRLGTVRRPPRGGRKEDYARRNYFDVWLPELAPSAPLVSWALSEPFTPKRWTNYERRYLSEMRKPPAQRIIGLLAALLAHTNFSIGCYCEDESHCHRTLLRKLLIEQDATINATGSDQDNRDLYERSYLHTTRDNFTSSLTRRRNNFQAQCIKLAV